MSFSSFIFSYANSVHFTPVTRLVSHSLGRSLASRLWSFLSSSSSLSLPSSSISYTPPSSSSFKINLSLSPVSLWGGKPPGFTGVWLWRWCLDFYPHHHHYYNLHQYDDNHYNTDIILQENAELSSGQFIRPIICFISHLISADSNLCFISHSL